jgi:hypothetical protein
MNNTNKLILASIVHLYFCLALTTRNAYRQTYVRLNSQHGVKIMGCKMPKGRKIQQINIENIVVVADDLCVALHVRADPSPAFAFFRAFDRHSA